MRWLLLHIVWLVCTICGNAQQLVFSSIDTSNGLSDNFVFHVTQLHDGRIVATTRNSIDLWNGSKFSHIKKERRTATPLLGYHGAYHVYTDKDNQLWVKDYQKLWCYDANQKLKQDCLPDSANDVFVDDEGEVFFIHQDTADVLLDLKALEGKQYRFYASGTVRCLDNGLELYAVRAPLESTAVTSLVITDKNRKKFYQLIDQKICIEFDTESHKWTEIFRSQNLHTISQTDANTAYIVSRDGIWKLDLNSRHAERVDQVIMSKGTYISSSRLNTIYTDNKGIVWIGSYDHGLLKGQIDNVDTASSNQFGWIYIILYIIGGLGLVAVCGWFWLKRKHNTITKEDNQEPSENIVHVSIDDELIRRATALVENNLATPNYTVERLAQDLYMERTGLYKKMVSMTGKTPTAFIRRIRIENAIRLIREGHLTMNEVAEHSGFSSASYMAKCFQEDLGKKPAEYRDNQP